MFPGDGGRRRDCLCFSPDTSGVEGREDVLGRPEVCSQGGRWAEWPLSPRSVLGVCLLFGKKKKKHNSLRAERLAHGKPFFSHAAYWLGLTSDSHSTSKRSSLNFSPNKFWSTQASSLCCSCQQEWEQEAGWESQLRRSGASQKAGKPDTPSMDIFKKSPYDKHKDAIYIRTSSGWSA